MYSYWTLDNNGNPRYLSGKNTDEMTNHELSKAVYFSELTGRKTFLTFANVKEYFETYTDSFGNLLYKNDFENVFEFLRDAWEWLAPLAPVKESKEAIAKIKRIMKRNNWLYEDFEMEELEKELIAEYKDKIVPYWLFNGGAEDIVEYIRTDYFDLY